jgi:hypothetical protein
MMRKRTAAIGTAVMFIVGPGLVIGVVPWLLTRWQFREPTPYWAIFRVLGVLLILVGLLVLIQAFARFVTEGAGTPLPAAAPKHLVVGGIYRHFNITWGDADREAHRRGVLECLEAIAAGEIYQACVCTQFAGRLDGAPVDVFVEAVERTSPARAAYLTGEWGARAAGGTAGAGHMASRVDGVGPGRGQCADGRLPRRDVPTRVGDRHTEAAGPSAAARLGATPPRDILRHSMFGVTRRGL